MLAMGGKLSADERNIGVQPYRITMDLKQLLHDCQYWIDHQTYQPDEIAMRFSHRLVQIHLYPNGTGRHSRVAADLLLIKLDQDRFSWGRTNPVDVDETRKQYIAALGAANNHNYNPLRGFIRF